MGVWRPDAEKIEDLCDGIFTDRKVTYYQVASNIMEHLRTLGYRDVWGFPGHGGEGGIIRAGTILRRQYIRREALEGAMAENPQSPGLVLLASCHSIDLDSAFILSGSRCVVSWRGAVSDTRAVRFMVDLMQYWCETREGQRGRTLNEAFACAQQADGEREFEDGTATVLLRCKARQWRHTTARGWVR